MSFIRTFVDNDLAFAISLRDFARILVQPRPIQPRERRIVKMTFNDVTDVGKVTIAMGAKSRFSILEHYAAKRRAALEPG